MCPPRRSGGRIRFLFRVNLVLVLVVVLVLEGEGEDAAAARSRGSLRREWISRLYRVSRRALRGSRVGWRSLVLVSVRVRVLLPVRFQPRLERV